MPRGGAPRLVLRVEIVRGKRHLIDEILSVITNAGKNVRAGDIADMAAKQHMVAAQIDRECGTNWIPSVPSNVSGLTRGTLVSARAVGLSPC